MPPMDDPRDAVDLVLSKLDGVRKQAGYWQARCPAHEDRVASLSVTTGKQQPVVLNCHAGCHVEDVVAAAGLTWAEICNGQATADHPVLVATYAYTDVFGEVLFCAGRYEPKGFKQWRVIGGRKVWSLGDVRRGLYHLPQLVMGIAGGRTGWVGEG